MPEEILRVRQRAVVVDAGIAGVGADAVDAVLPADRDQLLRDEIEGRIPADLLPALADAAHRPAQPVRIFVDVFQRHGLGTDVPTRQWIGVVAADRQHLAPAYPEFQAANGL